MDKIGVKPIGNIILSGNKKYVLVQNEAEFLVPIDNFDEIIMKNIFEEASKLLIALGAKAISCEKQIAFALNKRAVTSAKFANVFSGNVDVKCRISFNI